MLRRYGRGARLDLPYKFESFLSDYCIKHRKKNSEHRNTCWVEKEMIFKMVGYQ